MPTRGASQERCEAMALSWDSEIQRAQKFDAKKRAKKRKGRKSNVWKGRKSNVSEIRFSISWNNDRKRKHGFCGALYVKKSPTVGNTLGWSRSTRFHSQSRSFSMAAMGTGVINRTGMVNWPPWLAILRKPLRCCFFGRNQLPQAA